MKTLLLTCFSFLFINVYCQEKGKPYYFKQVGWSINLPSAFKILDSTAEAVVNEKGKKVIESTLDTEVDFSSTVTLFSATLDVYNYLNATITPYNPAVDGDWNEISELIKQTVVEAFAQNMKDVSLDSSSSKVSIDGLAFDKFEVTARIDRKVIFTTVILSKLYNGYDFGISYLYMDDKTKKIIQDTLDGSKFKR